MKTTDLDALDKIHAACVRGRWSYDDGITDDKPDPPEQGKPAAVYGPDGEWIADLDCGMLSKERTDACGRSIAALHNAYPDLAEEIRALRKIVADVDAHLTHRVDWLTNEIRKGGTCYEERDQTKYIRDRVMEITAPARVAK